MPLEDSNRILIVSNEFDPHVDQMLVMLRELGIECLRWTINSFPLGSSARLETKDGGGYGGRLQTAAWEIDLQAVRSVWYRRMAPPDLPGHLTEEELRFARSEVRAAIDGVFRVFDWFWVNHPDRVRIAGSKPLQLKIAEEIGFRIPNTLLTNDPDAVREFFGRNGGDVIYKPFNSGFFANTQKICYTTPISVCELDHLDLIRTTPGIFQENVRKRIELRITVIGRKVFATEIHSQSRDEAKNDWREAEVEDLPHIPHHLPADIEQRCIAFLERFGLAYGAMDMILTPEGEYVFLENNPSGQFGWIEEKTGEPMTATLAQMLIAGRIL